MRSPRQAFLSIAVALVSPGVDAFFAGVQVSSSRTSRSLNTPVSPGDLAAVAKEMEDGSPAAVALPGEGSRGKLVLGSKSFTRKMIVEEMGFTPVIRQELSRVYPSNTRRCSKQLDNMQTSQTCRLLSERCERRHSWTHTYCPPSTNIWQGPVDSDIYRVRAHHVYLRFEDCYVASMLPTCDQVRRYRRGIDR